jgi:flavin reductase (DIM6/NTAB) family NADH-FMN oxidoreductase RutF
MQIAPDSLSPGRRHFLLSSCVVPRPIAWVSTVNTDGSFNLAPFSYFNAFSSNPPIVGIGFAPHEEKGHKDTLANLIRTGEMVVSIPNEDNVHAVEVSAEDRPYGDSEFTRTGLTPTPASVVAAPLVAEAKVALECTLHQALELGDAGNTLALAEIRMVHILDTLLDDYGCVNPHSFRALGRMNPGRYCSIGEVFKAEDRVES